MKMVRGLQQKESIKMAADTALNNSLVRRIGTLNCGHAAFPIILGVSSPQYTAEELERLRQDNAAGIDYQGKHYTGYEATQMQRRVENSIRNQRRQILVDEATGSSQLQTDQIRLVRLNDEYARFSKAAGLRTQTERLEVSGFGPRQEKRAAEETEGQLKELLANAQKGDKIILNEDMENIIAGKPFSDIQPFKMKLSNRASRKWYLAHDDMIPDQIYQTQSLESQARQACELRNTNRTCARDLMRDQKERMRLDMEYPNRDFDDLINDKMKRKGLSREQAIEDILATATKTRKSVNKMLGLG